MPSFGKPFIFVNLKNDIFAHFSGYIHVSYILVMRSLVLMTGLIILWVNVIVLCYDPKRTPKYDELF